jgi:hypothetical protein
VNRLHAIGAVLMLVASSSGGAQQGHWPTIKPAEVERTYDVSQSRSADTPLSLILRDVNHKPVYRLECHNGAYDVLSEYSYSGDFHCALFALKRGSQASWNLLATSNPAQQRSDWMNRGRMLAWQLYGTCGDVPDYGRNRRFRLRHMQLTLQFKNIRWRTGTRPLDPVLDRFTVRVHASPDANARTETSAPAPLRTEPTSCDFPSGG